MKSIVKIVTLSACLVGGASAAWAADVDILFANTVVMTVVTPERQSTTKYFYNADGTVTTDKDASGKWEVRGDQLCTDMSTPEATEKREFCGPVSNMATGKPGDTWEFSPTANVTIKGELVAGR